MSRHPSPREVRRSPERSSRCAALRCIRTHEAKDKLNLDLPLNVATTNEVVGGNSGSPLLNKNAELIGLVFDSNLSGRGNAYVYRTEHRTVAVDSACILEILSKVYRANRVVQEIRAANSR